jgi:hypothetical protein
MIYYITRVELRQHASAADYEQLHTLMAHEGFSRTITASNGITSQLPPAEYLKASDSDIASVLNSARRAAQASAHYVAVLVTAGERVSWDGLQQAK